MSCTTRLPSTARMRIFASRTSDFTTDLLTRFAERDVVTEQVFRVNTLGLKQGMQAPCGILKGLQVGLADRPLRWDVVANGKAVTGNGERGVLPHVFGEVLPEFSDANGFHLCRGHGRPPMCTQGDTNIVLNSSKSKGGRREWDGRGKGDKRGHGSGHASPQA